MTDLAIRVENLSKPYPVSVALRTGRRTGPQVRYKTIREALTETVQAPFRGSSSLVPRPILYLICEIRVIRG